MTMTVPIAAIRLQNDVRATEAAVSEALKQASGLLHHALAVKADHPEIDPRCGHSAILRIHEAVGSLIAVDGLIRRAHSSMAKDAQVYAGMDEPTCPDDEIFKTAVSDTAAAEAA